MTEERTLELLARYMSKHISPEEEEELLNTAAGNQEVFNAMADQQLFQELLGDGQSRRVLLNAVSQPAPRESWWKSLVGWRGLALAGALAVLVTAVFLTLPDHSNKLEPNIINVTGGALSPAAQTRLSQLATTSPAGGPQLTLEFGAGQPFRVGGDLRVTFGASEPASLLLLEASAGQPLRVLFPLPATASADVPAGEARTLAPGTARLDLPVRVAVHLLAFPAQSDLKSCLKDGSNCPSPLAVRTIDTLINP
jgi:hypothetical protein